MVIVYSFFITLLLLIVVIGNLYKYIERKQLSHYEVQQRAFGGKDIGSPTYYYCTRQQIRTVVHCLNQSTVNKQYYIYARIQCPYCNSHFIQKKG